MLIGAIADDFTGATDVALTLSKEGMRVLLTIGPHGPRTDIGDFDAVVVSLKSRTAPVSQAVDSSIAAAQWLREAGAQQIVFKYCSTFDSTEKGNIGPVIDALLDFVGATRTIACPAFPSNGRTVYQGHLFVGRKLLSESSMRNHPLTPMRDPDLTRVLGPQTRRPVSLIALDAVSCGPDAIAEALDATEGIAIVDAVSDADLRSIGRAVRGLKLVTGASGIAMGLPANFDFSPSAATMAKAPPGGNVTLAGSCSEATLSQIAFARAAGVQTFAISPGGIAEGTVTVEDAAAFALANQEGLAPLIYSSTDAATLDRERAGRLGASEAVERFFARLAVVLHGRGISRFIVAGGETSGAVVKALGVAAMRIGPEIDPGVAWVTSDAPAAALALKSGNFGGEDFFVRAWEMLK